MEELIVFWQQYVRLFNGGDVGALANLYAEDVHLMMGEIPFRIEGREDVRDVLNEVFSAFRSVKLNLHDVKHKLLGDVAVYSGYYRFVAKDQEGQTTIENGRFLGTLVKVSDQWVIAANHGAALP